MNDPPARDGALTCVTPARDGERKTLKAARRGTVQEIGEEVKGR